MSLIFCWVREKCNGFCLPCAFYKQLATGVPSLTRFSFPSVFLNVLVGVKVNGETCVRVTGVDENGTFIGLCGVTHLGHCCHGNEWSL